MMDSENSGKTNVMRAAPIREPRVRRREMIDQMELNFIRKQIGFLTDRAPEECAWPCLVRKSVSPDENLVNLSGFGRIAPTSTVPSREQVSDRSQEPDMRAALTGPFDRPFVTDSQCYLVMDWIGEIARLWAKGNCATLELARVVSAARNGLPHGGWSALWNSDGMPSIIPFSKRKGEMLVAVGDGLGWANAHVCAHLPSGLRTLCYLAKLDRTTLERLIEEGAIHPKLKESKARELVAQLLGETLKEKSTRTILLEGLRWFESFLLAILPDCSPTEKQQAHAYLVRLLEQFGVAGEPDRSPILIKVVA